MFTASPNESLIAESVTGTAQNDGVSLEWEHFPTGGEPLLLVSGLGSPRVSYADGFIAEMANAGFECVRFDNRDAGRSTSTDGGYRLVDMANDAAAVMSSVGWDTAHVFGMSMGGMIVQQLGISFESRLRTITSLMSTTGERGFGQPTEEAMEALLTPSPDEREAWLEQRVKTEKVWGTPATWTPEAARAKGERLFDYGVQPRSVIHQYQAIVKSPARAEALAQVQTPTLVLHGTEDTLIQPSGGERTAEVMPNATYQPLEGMGHDLPPTYWPQIAKSIASFVAAAGFSLS